MRNVGIKVLADSASYERAMLESGASTEHLAKTMDKAAKQSRELTQATIAARTAALEQAAAERAAAAASSKSASAAKKAATAKTEQAEANRLAKNAADALERGEISAAEAQKLSARAARADRDAQLANAAAERAAVIETEKLERAAIKAATAQLAQAKAAHAARDAAARNSGGYFRTAIRDAKAAGEEAGGLFGNGLVGGAKAAVKTLAALPPEISIPIIIGAATLAGAAAAEIGAAVGGAALAGIGGAGIGVAVASQISDPHVKAALSTLGADAKSTLQEASSVFVDPIIAGADRIDTMLDNISPELRQIFAALAPSLTQLVDGLAEAGENVMPGLVDAAQAVAPIFNSLGRELPELGSEFSDFFHDISLDSKGAAEGVNALFLVFKLGLFLIGNTIAGAELAIHRFFDELQKVAGLLSYIPGGKELAKVLASVTDTSGKASKGVSDYGQSAVQTASEAEILNDQLKTTSDQFDSIVNKAVAASNADLEFRDALAGVTKAVQDNGTSLDVNTAKGRENVRMFNDLISKAEADRQANIANGMSIDKANEKFDEAIGRIYKQAAAAGYNRGQINKMIASLLGIPPKVAAQVGLTGAKTAQEEADAVRYALDKIHNKIVTITTRYVEYRTDRGGRALVDRADGGILEHHAAGGVRESHIAQIAPAGAYRLWAEDETGGEAYIPLAEAKHDRSMAVWQETGRRLNVQLSDLLPLARGLGRGAAYAPAPPRMVNRTINVYPQRADFTADDLYQREYEQDILERVGRQ